ncbi:MAG TPA: SPFH domain-containing protein [Elusimicrobiota bacterium]|nr:SPFH domain-containing protein [Elusimicrobiota bacterium]
MGFIAGFVGTFIGCSIAMPVFLGILRAIGFYTIVEEGTCRVYMLFGKVLGDIREPGLHLLWFKLGPASALVGVFGQCNVVDMRLDQQYLRSQAVNSEEGAPMGIGIWYEMFVSDPLNFLFKNADPRGSLRANVSNAAVRCLSNMPLASMMESRHAMSQSVREEVSPKSHEWGYQLGSVYIRKVHFRDVGMIKQIEEKVVNRLRQVTSAIKQDGVNQVSVITSTAERQAATANAQAAAVRPMIVGSALQRFSADPQIAEAMFDILECQRLLEAKARITLLPAGEGAMAQLLAARGGSTKPNGAQAG